MYSFVGTVPGHPDYKITHCGRVLNTKTNKLLKPIKDGSYLYFKIGEKRYTHEAINVPMDRDEFVAHMKAHPNLWRGGQKGNLVSKGQVMIYQADDVLVKTRNFCDRTRLREILSSSVKEIQNLKGYYILIKYKY